MLLEMFRIDLLTHSEDPKDKPENNVEEETYNEDNAEVEYEDEVEEIEREEEDYTPEKIQRAYDAAFAKAMSKMEKRLKKMFGTADLEQVASYYQAGKAITTAANVTPREALERLKTQYGYNPAYPVSQTNVAPPEIMEEIRKLQEMVAGQREYEVRERQIAESRKEYGKLFDEYREDILDKAEETGLSIVDAAAIVLRPHLTRVQEEKIRARQEKQKRRRVEDAGGVPSQQADFEAKLSSEQRATAKLFGMTPKEYYVYMNSKGRPKL